MPPRRDLEEARVAVVDVAVRVLARDGLDGFTIRQVAREAGVSTSFVTHYFADKRDLVLATFHAQTAAARARIDDAARSSTADLLLDVLVALLPVDAVRLQEWRVWLAYQSLALGDEGLTREWRRRYESHQRRLLALLSDERRAGRMPATVDPSAEAVHLQALVDGIAVRVVLRPAALRAAAQRRLVADYLHRLRTSG